MTTAGQHPRPLDESTPTTASDGAQEGTGGFRQGRDTAATDTSADH